MGAWLGWCVGAGIDAVGLAVGVERRESVVERAPVRADRDSRREVLVGNCPAGPFAFAPGAGLPTATRAGTATPVRAGTWAAAAADLPVTAQAAAALAPEAEAGVPVRTRAGTAMRVRACTWAAAAADAGVSG